MKLDEDVKMISAEAPLLFSKAAEMFIHELSLRAWIHTEDNKRRTLQVRRGGGRPAALSTTGHTLGRTSAQTGIRISLFIYFYTFIFINLFIYSINRQQALDTLKGGVKIESDKYDIQTKTHTLTGGPLVRGLTCDNHEDAITLKAHVK